MRAAGRRACGYGGFQPEAEQPAIKSGKQYVVAIGINGYPHWKMLNTAVSDATEFAKLLHDNYQFELWPQHLIDKDATGAAINHPVRTDLKNHPAGRFAGLLFRRSRHDEFLQSGRPAGI